MSYHRHAFNWKSEEHRDVPKYQFCVICGCYPEHFIAKDFEPWPEDQKENREISAASSSR